MNSAVLIVLIAVAAYLLPSIIGWARGHRNERALVAFNVFTGWTVVGWVVALVWSVYNEPSNDFRGLVRRRT